MPKTGMAMETGVLVEWKVKKGDRVQKGDVIALIETDKSAMELESDYDGVILALLCGEGDTVPVTVTIAWIGEEGEPAPTAAGDAVVPSVTPMAGDRVKATPAARRLARENVIDLSGITPGGKHGEIRAKDLEDAAKVRATPLARRVAEAEGISLNGIRGSGHGGKIFSADLETAGAGVSEVLVKDKEVPLSRIQQITGKRLQESRQEIPDVVLHAKADVTKLLAVRKEINEEPGIRITINDFVLAATVKALVANPRLNSVYAGDKLIYKATINLGVAVATEKGLVVPVIKSAQTLGFRQISLKAAELAELARSGKLNGNDLEGGTFTVSNMGMYGITMFTPIINPPEAAILGVCAIEEIVKLENDKLINHHIMGLSLSFDHRIVDGAEAALFMKTLREFLESPYQILL